MPRFFGEVGYVETQETSQDVWEEVATERSYYGDVIREAKRFQPTTTLNDNLVLNNTVSIVADPYAYEHYSGIRYVKWMGANWKVSSVEVQRPRLILALGEVYNGLTP